MNTDADEIFAVVGRWNRQKTFADFSSPFYSYYSLGESRISDKIVSVVWRSIHLNAEDAEVLAKDAKVISLRSSAKTFATSALKRCLGCGSAALGSFLSIRGLFFFPS